MDPYSLAPAGGPGVQGCSRYRAGLPATPGRTLWRWIAAAPFTPCVRPTPQVLNSSTIPAATLGCRRARVHRLTASAPRSK